MAEFELIEEQENILKSSGEGLVVCASAGSGKTSVMIRKIASLIVEFKIPVSEILVLTYTNAAATEMKERLRSTLRDADSEFAIKELDELSIADISTVHSFCDKLIKKYGSLCGIDIGLTLISEGMQNYLRGRALKRAIENLCETAFADYLLIMKIYRRNEEAISGIVFGMENYKRSSLDFNIMKNTSDTKGAEKILNDNLLFGIRHFKSLFERLISKAKNIEYIKWINEVQNELSKISEEVEFAVNYENLIEMTFSDLRRAGEVDEGLFETIKKSRDEIKAFIAKFKGKDLGSRTIQERANSRRAEAVFFELFKRYEDFYTTLKQKAGAVDFEDLERLTLKILENEEVLRELRESYKFVFIDEYQDANRVQEKIIKLIARKDNLFVVGDPKQGIYGFRQACPDIILEDFNSNEYSPKTLKCNFRSAPEVLEFVNEIFSVIMTEETSKINYRETSMLMGKANYPKGGKKRVAIDVLLLPEGEAAYSKAAAEAVIAASRINEVMREKIYDKELSAYREAEYSDIAVLVRSRREDLDDFVGKLQELGIPVISDSRENLLKDSYVKQVFNYLKICNFFFDDFTLAGVMMSRLGGFSAAELARIRKNSDGSFYEAVLASAKEVKVAEFLAELSEIKNLVAVKGAFIATYVLCERKGFFAEILEQGGGEGEVSKVKLFLNGILDSGHNFSLAGIVDHYENGRGKSFSSYTAGGGVSVSTIHSVKGLEFPVVILVNTGASLSSGGKEEFKIDREFGLALKFYDEQSLKKYSTVVYEAIRIKNKAAEFGEELRVLYVALTRAKNKLYIVGTTKNKSYEMFRSDFDTKKASSFLELILRALDVGKLDQFKNGNRIFELKVHGRVMFEEKKPELIKPPVAINIAMAQKIKTYLNYVYPYSNATKNRLKTSVTKLQLRRSDKFKAIIKDELTRYKNKGTIYHNLLKLINFNEISNMANLKANIEKLSVAGKINYKEIKFINLDNLLKNIELIKSLSSFGGKIFKEYQFVMKAAGSGEDILIQGVIDLLILGEKSIIVDYKYSGTKDAKKIAEIYKTQLDLYSDAVHAAFGVPAISKYVLSLKDNKLIKLN